MAVEPSLDLVTLLSEDTVITSSVARRAAVMAVGGYDEGMPAQGDEDWDLWISLVKAGYHGVILPEVLFFYRRRRGSMCDQCTSPATHLELFEYLLRKHGESYRTHLLDVLLLKEESLAELSAETSSWRRDLDVPRALPRTSATGASTVANEARPSRERHAFQVEYRRPGGDQRPAHVRQLANYRAPAGRLRRVPAAATERPVTSSRTAVVITCYDLGRTLDEALASVRAQTHPPSEIVIVDDGSSDIYTRQVLARLEAAGHRVVRTPNRGVSAARNLGVSLTKSPYIVLLDGDDCLAPPYLAAAAAYLDAHSEHAFVSCGMKAFGLSDQEWRPASPNLVRAMTHGILHVSSMFRREMWDAIGGFDEQFRYHEEQDFWTMALEKGFTGDVLPDLFFHYRVRAGSLYHRAIRPETHLKVMESFFRKHLATAISIAEPLLLAKERFILEQREHYDSLRRQKSELEAEIAD